MVKSQIFCQEKIGILGKDRNFAKLFQMLQFALLIIKFKIRAWRVCLAILVQGWSTNKNLSLESSLSTLQGSWPFLKNIFLPILLREKKSNPGIVAVFIYFLSIVWSNLTEVSNRRPWPWLAFFLYFLLFYIF